MSTCTQREQLILKHYGLVHQIARKMASKYPACVELDDLISIGTVGLIDAADRFDDSLNVSFGSYARIRIQGTIVDALRKQDWVPRVIRSRHRMYIHAQQALQQRLNRRPSNLETSEFLSKLGVKNVASFVKEANLNVLVSTEDKRPDTEQRLGDTLKSKGSLPDAIVGDLELRERIATIINSLPPRDQHIVQLYYFEALSLRAIGEILDVTESRVCQLHRRIRKRISDALTAERIEQAA